MQEYLIRTPANVLRFLRFLDEAATDCCNALFNRAFALASEMPKLDVRIAVMLGACTIGLYLFQTIGAGLSTDDAHRPYLAAFSHLTGAGIWETMLAEQRDASRSNGGFFPLESVGSIIWTLAPSVIVMRSLQVAAIVVNSATFGFFVARASRSNGLALLTLGCVALSLQLRLGSDAVIGPILKQQLVVECAIISFLAAIYYLRNGSRRLIVCTMLSATAAALVDSLGYFVCIGVTLVLVTDRYSPLKRRIPAIAVACIPMICLELGVLFATPTPATLAHVDDARTAPLVYLTSASQRLIAAVPTAYRATGSLVSESVKGSAADTRFDRIPAPGLVGWFAVLAITICITMGSLTAENPNTISRNQLICVGLSCWILPAFGSARYEHVGQGAYLQAFGVGLLLALVLAALLARTLRPVQRATIIASSGLLALLVAFGNVRANAFVVTRATHDDVARELLTSAIDAGLFTSIPANVTLVPTGFNGIEAGTSGVRDFRFAAYAASGKSYLSGRQSELLGRSALCRVTETGCAPRADTYLIVAETLPHTEGSLTALRWTGSDGTAIMSDGGSRFARFLSVAGRAESIAHDVQVTGESVQISAVPFENNSLLTTARRLCGPVRYRAAFDAVSAAVSWGAGFYAPYPAIPFIASNNLAPRKADRKYNDWSYAGPSGHLIVTDEDCVPKPFELTANVYTSVPARLDVRYLHNHYTYTSTQDGVTIRLPVAATFRHVDVAIETDAPTGHDVYTEARFADARAYDIRMLVDKPTAVVGATQ